MWNRIFGVGFLAVAARSRCDAYVYMFTLSCSLSLRTRVTFTIEIQFFIAGPYGLFFNLIIQSYHLGATPRHCHSQLIDPQPSNHTETVSARHHCTAPHFYRTSIKRARAEQNTASNRIGCSVFFVYAVGLLGILGFYNVSSVQTLQM